MLEPQLHAGFVIGFTAATFLGILFDFLIRRRNRARRALLRDAMDSTLQDAMDAEMMIRSDSKIPRAQNT